MNLKSIKFRVVCALLLPTSVILVKWCGLIGATKVTNEHTKQWPCTGPVTSTELGFLATEGINPAHSLHGLILQAGDIETNPGQSYFWCKDVIRPGAPHLKCNACGNCWHKQQKCSGLSRIAQQKHSEPNGEPWTKSSHDKQPPQALLQTADVAQQGEFCHACGLAFWTGVQRSELYGTLSQEILLQWYKQISERM